MTEYIVNNVIQLHSDISETEVEKEFADNVANEQYVIKSGGHINSESGYTKFEEILKEI